jgi:hypothetical protein
VFRAKHNDTAAPRGTPLHAPRHFAEFARARHENNEPEHVPDGGSDKVPRTTPDDPTDPSSDEARWDPCRREVRRPPLPDALEATAGRRPADVARRGLAEAVGELAEETSGSLRTERHAH